MNPVSVGLVAAFAVFAVADWRAVAAGDVRQERLTKPMATLVLVALAGLGGEMAGESRAALIVAVVLCLAGDLALLGKSDTRFLAGLGAFALGHVAYVVTALLVGVSWPRLAAAFPLLAALLGLQAATRMLPGARRQGGTAMLAAVALYSAIISAMVVTATGTPHWAAALGGALFAISDSMIGYRRFVRPFRHADVAVMTTYHLGQLLLIGGMIAGG